MTKISQIILLLSLYYVLIIGYPGFMIILSVGKLLKITDVTYWEFTRDWFLGRIIP